MVQFRLMAAAVAALWVALSGVAVQAAFEEPPGWTRPNDNIEAAADLTTYQEWTPSSSLSTPYFDIAPGTNPPNNASNGGAAANPNGTADVYDASGLGGIASSGNIYSQEQVIDPVVVVPSYNLGAGWATLLLVQVRTSGQDLTPGLLVNGVDATTLGGFSYERLIDVAATFTPPGSDPVTIHTIEHQFVFTVPGSAASYTLDFDWQGLTSTSLGHLRVDTLTTAVPTPASAAAGAIGLIALAMRRSRRKGV